jgi:hypothetical protein
MGHLNAKMVLVSAFQKQTITATFLALRLLCATKILVNQIKRSRQP